MHLLMTNDLQNSRNPEEIIQDDRKTRNAESDPRPRTLKSLLRDLLPFIINLSTKTEVVVAAKLKTIGK